MIISTKRPASGFMLIQCLVYLAVFAVLTGVGLGAFYLCWDHAKAMTYATDDIGMALRAGEQWREDVRQATGKILIERTAGGERVRIPHRDREIIYRFESGEVRRVLPESHIHQLLLPKVRSSDMSLELRNGATAWRWELELVVTRPETQLPLLFTFEAAQTKS
jgi:hypothetical protein